MSAVAPLPGRWCGRWFEWECETCGRVLTATETPASPELRRCLGCRVDSDFGIAQRGIRELAVENARISADLRERDKTVASLVVAHNRALAALAEARAFISSLGAPPIVQPLGSAIHAPWMREGEGEGFPDPTDDTTTSNEHRRTR